MAQNRKPPAYQEYASTMLASKPFKLMSLAERGLLYTIRLECWENKEVPANLKDLAKYLGFEYQEINEALTTNVMSFFKSLNQVLISLELEDYRQHLEQIRTKKIEGGKIGAEKTNSKNRQLRATEKINSSPSEFFAIVAGKSTPNPKDTRNSLVQLNSEKQSQSQSINSEHNHQWIEAYEQVDTDSYNTILS